MQSNRQVDANGFMHVKACPISSFGIFHYSAGQLGLPGDQNRIVNVYRPESAVSDPEAIESFKNIPLINNHTLLSGNRKAEDEEDDGSISPEEKGVDGVLTSNVYYDSPWMRGDLTIYSRSMQDAINAGKTALSLGYACEYREEAGFFQGTPYEVVQDKMRGNHIALVGEARVAGARVLDGMSFDHLDFQIQINEDADMTKKLSKKAFDNAVEQLKALLPALSQFLSEEATEPAHQEGAAGGAEGAEAGSTGQTGEETQTGEEQIANNVDESQEEASSNESAGAKEGDKLQKLVSEIKAVLAAVEGMAGGSATDDDETEGMAEDTVEGLQESGGVKGAQTDVEEAGTSGENGSASKGPKGGTNSKASDSAVAIRAFHADLATKTRLYHGISSVVGAFDHANMDARQVAAYGLKKFGLDAAAGSEIAIVDVYLKGLGAKGKAEAVKTAKQAVDSAEAAKNEVDSFLNSL